MRFEARWVVPGMALGLWTRALNSSPGFPELAGTGSFTFRFSDIGRADISPRSPLKNWNMERQRANRKTICDRGKGGEPMAWEIWPPDLAASTPGEYNLH